MAQEAERGARGQRRQDARLVAFEREGDRRQGDRGDHADAGGEPVDAVEEVDHVGDGDDPEHGQRIGPAVQLEAAEEGQRQVLHPHPLQHRDQRGGDLAEELRQRRQVVDVVEEADRRHRHAADQDRATLAVAGQPDPARRLDRDQDRQAREAGHRPVVEAALLRVVDRAEPEGEPLGVGHQQPGDRRGGDEGEYGVGGRGQVEGFPRRLGRRALGAPRVGLRLRIYGDGAEDRLDQEGRVAWI